MKANDLLIPALRQYRHNDGIGLLAGYDIEETEKIVLALIERLEYAETKQEEAENYIREIHKLTN